MRRLLLTVLVGAVGLAASVTAAGAASSPGLVSGSAARGAGTYSFTNWDGAGHSHANTVTVGPVTHGVPPAPARTAARAASAYWCRTVTWTNADGGLENFLLSNFCWNGSTAVAYGVVARCASDLPGAVCFYQRWGTSCSYCGTAGAWGNYYGACIWGNPCNEALGLWTNRYGAWWGNSWGI